MYAPVVFLPSTSIARSSSGDARNMTPKAESTQSGRVRPSTARARSSLEWAWLAATGLAIAGPAADEPHRCEAASPAEATALAERLYETRDYQRAGECYEAAGDFSRAQQAFLAAVGPNGEATARGLKEQHDTAKALLNKVRQAFHSRQ